MAEKIMHHAADRAPYLKTMESIDSDILERVLQAVAAHDPATFAAANAKAALARSRLGVEDFAALLSPAASVLLEPMAARARLETRKHFGNAVSLFTPLYIANYCVNQCVYCGFNCANDIHRAKLESDEIARELDVIAATGLEDILLLTGETRTESDVAYIGAAVKMAAERFKLVGVEVYPLNVDEYAFLHACGADYVCVFQETYDPVRYAQVHPKGPKRVFSYRFDAQERAIRGGMRSVAFGALLGLADFRKDALATGLHAALLQRKYPHAEISFSLPRLRPHVKNAAENSHNVHERELLQVMLAYRLFLPFAGMTISTRERPGFRDHAVGLCATKISAGVSVGVGGHTGAEKGDGQFIISDPRSVSDVHRAILSQGLQPVYNDYVRV
jgi:2-iminoacetate synthase